MDGECPPWMANLNKIRSKTKKILFQLESYISLRDFFFKTPPSSVALEEYQLDV